MLLGLRNAGKAIFVNTHNCVGLAKVRDSKGGKDECKLRNGAGINAD